VSSNPSVGTPAAQPAATDRSASNAATAPPEMHHDHQNVSGGWLRPAMFGVSDGLVSNFALIAGVAGGGLDSHQVALTGLAGLAAGAFSMAAGEYTSVRSQQEVMHAELAIERAEIARRPKAEEAELARIYRKRGLDPALAQEVAQQLSRDPDTVWKVHAREELGVDPDALPSPWVAALASFLAFAVGAFIPLLPYLLGAESLGAALVLAGLGLFAAGALVSRFTRRQWWYSGTRQLVLGGVAAGVTYLVGHLVGASVG
jgi:VIT1/CCC1 family predicted Fe2+/Mn2+ transporter